MKQLATRFGRNVNVFRSDAPLSDEQIMRVAPSIFAQGAHESRSQRYAYIPTAEVLGGLRKEGFQPFMVCQTKVRDESKREHTKHMLRLRHASQINGTEANEIILLNSHDGTSSYQMLAGVFRFVCHNGMVCGETMNDIRVPHRGDVVGNVIKGAFRVLDDFELVDEQKDGMKALGLSRDEQGAFARAALALKYDEAEAPVTDGQLLVPRRFDDRKGDLWTTFNVIQENLVKGGLRGRNRNGKTVTTRPVNGIDSGVKLNRALWLLAEEMKRLKA